MRDGGRRLSCPLPVDSLPDKYKTTPEKDHQAIADAAHDAKIKHWENRKNPTPAQIQAQAQADEARVALERAKAAAAAASTKYNAVLAANKAAGETDTATLQQQWKDLEAKQNDVASAQQSYDAATATFTKATAAKKLDAQQAQYDAEMRDVITSQRTEWEKQMEADAKAREAMLAELKATAAKREKDLEQAEADRKQAELDKQIADEALRKQHERERQQREAEREQHAAAAAAQQKQFSLNEEARLQRERDAKAAAAKNDAVEAEIKKREEARATRDHEIADADAKAREAEIEFQRKKAEHAATQKKYEELEKQHVQEENDRLAAEAKLKADKDKADADAQQKEEDVPEEEKPKREGEEDCAPSPVGSPPQCEKGGRCFQIKGKPEIQRCSCGKGYKGDKCEYEPCPPPAKEGNMVNGKCVKWESEYVCNGCNKIWDIKTTCYEIDAKTSIKKSTREANCKGLKEPENELYNRMCRFCLNDPSVSVGKGKKDKNWRDEDYDGKEDDAAGDDEDGEDSEDGGDGDGMDNSLRGHRRLVVPPVPARAPYEALSATTSGRIGMQPHSFAFSVYEHELVRTFPPAAVLDGVSSLDCVMQCFRRQGSVYEPAVADPMRADHCTWLVWTPPYAHRGVTYQSRCNLYNAGKFPVEPPRANPNGRPGTALPTPRVLANHLGTGMLAFAMHPRPFDMFRPINPGASHKDLRVDSGGTVLNLVARFSSSPAEERHGTYVTSSSPPIANCAVTAATRLEAGLLYQSRTGSALQATFPQGIATRVERLSAVAPVAMTGQAQATWHEDILAVATVAAGAQVVAAEWWRYEFDDLLRVHRVYPRDGIPNSISFANRGRTADSPALYRNAFNKIMRRSSYPPAADAGHLVAATQKPPNWFFNYVPQHRNSNQKNCWYRSETAARSLMEYFGCSLTYDVRVTYPTTLPPANPTAQECNAQFRPTKMSLGFRITAGTATTTGTGTCVDMANEWIGRPLVTNAGGTLVTSRLMAYTLQRAAYKLNGPGNGAHANDLTGLLHVATASAEFNECNTETGTIFAFTAVTLTPQFSGAKLVVQNECLGDQTVNGITVLTRFPVRGGPNCVLWSTVDQGHGVLPADLTDSTTAFCLVMSNINGGSWATFGSSANRGCLKFIYSSNPFAARGAAPSVFGRITMMNPTLMTPVASMTGDLNALVTGVIGTVNVSQQVLECLAWNPTVQGFYLTAVQANCVRVQITQTQL